MSEMVAFRQGTSMPSRETILHYVVETVNQITELEPALHLLPWSGVTQQYMSNVLHSVTTRGFVPHRRRHRMFRRGFCHQPIGLRVSGYSVLPQGI